MGYFSQLALDIEEMLFDGMTEAEIAEKLNLSLEEVEEQIALLEESDIVPDEYDETDDSYALASAGFGTDEDYGYACDDY